MASDDNGKKSKHGKNARRTMDIAVDELERNHAVKNVKDTPSYGYQGYQSDQFKADKEVTLADDSTVALFSTSSLRSDRVRTKQWQAHNIKQVSRVEYAVIILPDESAYDSGTVPRDEIRNNEVVSAIDDILTVKEFYDYAMDVAGANMGVGKGNDFVGRRMESMLVSVLRNRDNLKRLQGSETETGYMYDLYHKVMSAIRVNPASIACVSATNEVPSLPNGGNPKTDVAMTILLQDGNVASFTFTLKNSERDMVSVHEYPADAFADVLDPANEVLRSLLRAFQAAGSKKAMSPDDAEALERELKPYLRKLDRWVFGGYGGRTSDPIQLAEYIITHDKRSKQYAVHSIDEYIDALEKDNDGTRGFGTIYNRTYASKKRGKTIQLKAKVLV